jgi:phage-related protein
VAEEVGAAFVSLVPSARGFSAKARAALKEELAGKDFEVPITPKVDRADVTRALAGATAGQRGGVEVDTKVDDGQLRREVRTAVIATEATRPTVHVRIEVDRNTLRRSLAGLGGTVERSGSSLGGTFSRFFLREIVFSKVGLIAGLIGVLAPPGAALTAAASLLGTSLGAIFAGAFALRGNKDIQSAVKGLLGDIDKGLTKAAQPLVKPFLEAIRILGQAFKDMSPQVAEIFKAVAPYIPQLAEGIAGFLKNLTPGLVDAVKKSGPVIQQISFALPALGQGLGDFLKKMSEVSPEAGRFIGGTLRGLGRLLSFLGTVIQTLTRFTDSAIDFAKKVSGVVQQVLVGYGIMIGNLKGLVGDELKGIQKFIDKIKPVWDGFWKHIIPRGASDGLTAVVGLAKGLPGRVKNAVGDLKDLLYSAGRNIVQGLINGIKSKFGPLGSAASSMAGIVRSFLPFSPAKQGPLSGSGNPYRSGQVIADMLAGGMRSGLPTVESAADRLAAAVGAGGAARGGSALAAAPAQVVIGSDGSRLGDLLVEVLQGAIRTRGGNVQVVLGAGRA